MCLCVPVRVGKKTTLDLWQVTSSQSAVLLLVKYHETLQETQPFHFNDDASESEREWEGEFLRKAELCTGET